jgi:hypothetical protein
MLECCGCEKIALRSTYRWDNCPDATITYFPSPVTRHAPTWLSGPAKFQFRWDNTDLTSLFDEVYAALQAGSNRLAMMGARTLIDMVMLDKIGDAGSFDEKLSTMERTGYLSRTNREFLKQAINAGSAAAHRGHRPNDDDVNRVMDILENFVQAVYVLAPATDALRRSTPLRRPNHGAP